jgi:hypothetical protein
VVLKWPRYDREAVTRALTLAGFRPVASSNQVRIPVAAGRDPVDVALRALAAVGFDDDPAAPEQAAPAKR